MKIYRVREGSILVLQLVIFVSFDLVLLTLCGIMAISAAEAVETTTTASAADIVNLI